MNITKLLAAIALVTLVHTADAAPEGEMARRRLGQAYRAQDVVLALGRLTPRITPAVEAKDPTLRADVARLRERAGAAYSRFLAQEHKLLALEVGGDPDVVNTQVARWTYRKTAMVMQTLAMTGWRNDRELAAIERESRELERRAGVARNGDADGRAVTLLGTQAE